MKKMMFVILSWVVFSGCTHSGGTTASAEKKHECSHCESEGKAAKKACTDGSCSH